MPSQKRKKITPGGPSLTYDEYYAYLLQYAKKLEDSFSWVNSSYIFLDPF